MKIYMLRFFFIFIIFSCCSTTLFSQGLFDIFENNLPARILLDKNKTEMIKEKFNKIADMHPDLFYYYISYLFQIPSKQDSSKYYDNFIYFRNFYRAMKNKWLTDNLHFITQSDYDVTIKNYVKRYFEEMTQRNSEQLLSTKQDIGIDKNKMNFFALKFLQKNKFIEYDPQTDYSESRKAFEKSTRDLMLNKLKIILENPLENHDNLIKNMLYYWYLLDDDKNEVTMAKVLLSLFFRKTFFYNILYSKDLATIYKNFIPKALYKDNLKRKSISITLLDLVSIHPNLIYYYLAYISALQDESNPELVKNLYKIYNQKKSQFTQRRNEWSSVQIKNIIQNENSEEVQKSTKEYFQNLISRRDSTVTVETSENLKIETNKLHFFVLQYYHGDKELNYDKNIDYKTLRTKFENNFYTELKENYLELMNNTKLSTSKFVNNYLKYWYLFDSSNNNQENDVIASNMVLLLSRKQFAFNKKPESQKRELPPLFILFGMAKNNLVTHQEKIFNPVFDREWDIETPLNLTQTMISIKSRVKIRKYFTVLSYIDFQLSYIFSNQNELPSFNDHHPLYDSLLDEDGKLEAELFEDTIIKNSSITLNSQRSYALKLSVPILLITRNLKFEFGVQTGISSLSYDLKYDYDCNLTQKYYTETGVITTVLRQGSGNFNKKELVKKDVFFIPSLDFLMEFNKLNLTLSIYQKYYSANIGFRIF